MKRLTMYQTSDGAIHKNAYDARHHAEVRYGEALLTLAKKLAVIDKYKATAEFIDSNLNEFAKLTKLKNDSILEEDEDDSDTTS